MIYLVDADGIRLGAYSLGTAFIVGSAVIETRR